MFQLGLDLETDTQVTHWYVDVIRSFLSLFDRIVYWLLMIAYEVFFNISKATIISSDTVKDFYGRVQLIIGVFMIFKVSVSLMQSVMNPDRLTDKENGMGKIITRVITMLAMFAAIIPLNIPNAVEGSFNASLNENGLLFGTLYGLQERILYNNVLGKIIVGDVSTNTTEDEEKSTYNKETGMDVESSATQLATFVLKTFVRINLKKGASAEGAKDPENYMCESGWADNDNDIDTYEVWRSDSSTPNDILDNINDWCTGRYSGSDDNYSFVYTPIISTICGGAMAVILLMFCVDIAVRTFKLAILRLLAPIPIISYINPKSSKDGAFASWVKSLTSTYLDLFLRLVLIYFVLFMVKTIIENGIVFNIGDGTVGLISIVFIFIGLFFFARMAPKFIKDALGLKGSMSNIGVAGALAGAGALRNGGNLRDAFNASRDATDAQVAAYNQGKQAPGMIEGGYNVGADMMARELTGNDKMTARQMHRGRRQLEREGLTQDRVEDAKNDMYKKQDYAKKTESNYTNFVNGNMTQKEEEGLAAQFGQFNTATQRYEMNDDQRLVAKNYLQDSYLKAQSDAGRAESKYKDMDNEMSRLGGSRNSYRAKRGDLRDTHAGHRDARFSDLLTHEGREAMRTGSFRETLRNVSSMPQNSRIDRSDELNAEIGGAIDNDAMITAATNQRMNDSRSNRNGGNP